MESFGPPVRMLAGGRTDAVSATVVDIVRSAYRLIPNWPLESWQISGGPAWISSDRFNIDAKAATNATPQQMRLMLQSLLEDRFKLKIHWETRLLPVYEMSVAKGGVKVQKSKIPNCSSPNAADPDPNEPLIAPSPGERAAASCGNILVGAASKGAGAEGNLYATGVDMAMLAHFLTSFLGRTVINKTGFTQIFNAQVVFNPTDEALGAFRDDINEPPTPELVGGSIFTALQEQLGLKLESSRGPVQVLVIDSLQKPSEN
jgi:uncharacterized protein (TIGR03435 family)